MKRADDETGTSPFKIGALSDRGPLQDQSTINGSPLKTIDLSGGEPLGQSLNLERALEEFSDTVTLLQIPFESKVDRLLKISSSHLNMRFGVFIQMNDDGVEGQVIRAFDRVAELTLNHFPSAFVPGTRLEVQDTIFETIFRNSLPIEQHDPQFGTTALPADLNYSIGACVYVGDSPYGILTFLGRRSRTSSATHAERVLVKILARFLGNEIARNRVKDALTFRVNFEQLIASISTSFLQLPTQAIDDGIRETLKKIGEFCGVDLSYVFLFKDDDKRMDISHWWCADGKKPAFRVSDLSVDKYSWTMKHILKGEVSYMPDVEWLPAEASAEKRFSRAQGIKSAVMAPLICSGTPFGLVGFASTKTRKMFDRDVLRLLTMVGHIIASAIENKRAREAIARFEEQIRHTQKLESMGLFAGGIAHDFNNLLMGILGNAQLALEELPTKVPARKSIARIEKIALHAADLTTQLLAYSGKGRFVVEPINLSQQVSTMLDLLRSVISKKHTLVTNLDQNIAAMEGDASQIVQVIMNLITNASEAMGETSGSVQIETGVMNINEADVREAYYGSDAPPGSYVYLRVTDSGCGMTQEVLSRIFDPFFSTKFVGRGLGLAAVLGVVRGHEGIIKVDSDTGVGTSFTVLFPKSERELSVAVKPRDPEKLTSCEKTVLVVDDEEMVRSVVAEILKRQGFTVLIGYDGAHAIRTFTEHQSTIELVIVDLTMPDMNGHEVVRRLRELQPEIRAILMSGYSVEEASAISASEPFSAFLQKPFRPAELMRLIGDVLDRSERDGERSLVH